MSGFIEFKHIMKQYEKAARPSVDDFNLDIQKGEFIAFVGPSGCGKSTTLRMLAGFESISGGDLVINGQVMNDVPALDRGVSMVFQNYALYPHMTVEQNISFGLKNMKVPESEIQKKVDWAVKILGLEEYRKRKPRNLSGGQCQRVAVGRAIVKDRDILLMDEPLSNLDAKLRVSMRNEISKLTRSIGCTTIYVTHDQVEAMTMADRIVIMKDGVMQQVGQPMELYNQPANKFVAGFIGSPQMNFYDCTIEGSDLVLSNGTKIKIPDATSHALANYKNGVVMGIRGEDIKCQPAIVDNPEPGYTVLKAKINDREILGNENNLYFDLSGTNTIARVSEYNTSGDGDELSFVMLPSKMHFFEPTGNNNRIKLS